jgi:hypothetical protein
MNAFKLLAATVMIMVGVLLLMVLHDLIHPYKPIVVKITPDMFIFPEANDSDDWAETAAALGIATKDLTWDEFIAHDSLLNLQELQAYMKKRELE